MKKIILTSVLVAFVFSTSVNAQEKPKKETAKTEKSETKKEKKCDKDKKSCCASKKTETKS